MRAAPHARARPDLARALARARARSRIVASLHLARTNLTLPHPLRRSGFMGALDAELDAAVDWDAVRGTAPGAVVLGPV